MAVQIPCPECRAVTLLKDDGFQKLYIRAECPICKEQRPSPFRGFQCGHVVCDACYGELAARGFADGRETPTHVPRTEGNVPVPGEVSVGPASAGGYATEDPDVTPDPYDLGNVRNFERPGTSYEGGSRSDGRGATPSFPYPVQRNRPEAGRGREGRRTQREDPKKRFSKALVTLLRFPNTNFTHLWDTRIEVDDRNMSVRLREALELTESNVGGSRQYEELKALFDEIIADQADDKRRFRTYGHGPDTRVSATYGWWPRTPSVRLS